MSPSDDRKSTLVLPFPPMAPEAEIQEEVKVRPSSKPRDLDAIYVIDWIAAFLLFVLTLPILFISLLWVLVVDRGNPIFTQIRIGLHGEPYRIFKIRSMSHDHHGHARFCAHGDDRILPGGHFLRKTRIDELPQLINVLLGEMALVGPRPEQPAFVKSFVKLIPRYEERLQVKPGITGLAQITQGYVDSVKGTRVKLTYDLLFIKKRSLKLWFSIILGTIKVVLFRHGAR